MTTNIVNRKYLLNESDPLHNQNGNLKRSILRKNAINYLSNKYKFKLNFFNLS